MNKVRIIINKSANYVYHMLSVARCGYDNAYGERYRHLHSTEKLDVLKSNERLLTVSGGEHIGELYFEVIVAPVATGKCDIIEYYNDLILRFEKPDENSDFIRKYKQYTDNIIAISRVMLDNYDMFCDSVWAEEQNTLAPYARKMQNLFEQSDFTERAERLVGVTYKHDYFNASLCGSLSHGAEAIDISEDTDIFGTDRSESDEFLFIAHEFIIFLLTQALFETSAFKSLKTWSITEGLAEFYLEMLLGSSGFFDNQRSYIDFFKKKYNEKPYVTADALFRAALEPMNNSE